MNAQQYEKISAPLRRHPGAARALRCANKVVTGFCYAAFPLLVVWEFISGDPLWLRMVLTCGISFALVSFLRAQINAPRPYEELNIDPLIKKDTQGKSFPSRHAFSIFAVAMAFLASHTPAGIALLILGCCLSYIRVAGGVHYPRDVIAGAALGILSGIIGFWLIP